MRKSGTTTTELTRKLGLKGLLLGNVRPHGSDLVKTLNNDIREETCKFALWTIDDLWANELIVTTGILSNLRQIGPQLWPGNGDEYWLYSPGEVHEYPEQLIWSEHQERYQHDLDTFRGTILYLASGSSNSLRTSSYRSALQKLPTPNTQMTGPRASHH